MNERYFAELSPEQFEEAVQDIVRRIGASLGDFRVQRREKVSAADGTYEIDVTARFEALGAAFLVLIECKHQKAPIKREVVQILYDRMRAVGAQKGMLFATGEFQSGAVTYAKQHGIALVHVADGSFNYVLKAEATGMHRKFGAPYAAALATLNNGNTGETGDNPVVVYSNLDYYKVDAVLEFWEGSHAAS